MNRFGLTLALTLFGACATTAPSPSAGEVIESKPAVKTPPTRETTNVVWSETLPDVPGVILVHEGEQLSVIAEDGSELCSLTHEPGIRVDAAELTYACGELAK